MKKEVVIATVVEKNEKLWWRINGVFFDILPVEFLLQSGIYFLNMILPDGKRFVFEAEPTDGRLASVYATRDLEFLRNYIYAPNGRGEILRASIFPVGTKLVIDQQKLYKRTLTSRTYQKRIWENAVRLMLLATTQATELEDIYNEHFGPYYQWDKKFLESLSDEWQRNRLRSLFMAECLIHMGRDRWKQIRKQMRAVQFFHVGQYYWKAFSGYFKYDQD